MNFSPDEFAEYSQAARAAGERLLRRVDDGPHQVALSHLFMNRTRDVVVVVARDDAAKKLAAFVEDGGIHEIETVSHGD